MNAMNIILLIIGILILVLGISWSKKNWTNFILGKWCICCNIRSLFGQYLNSIE